MAPEKSLWTMYLNNWAEYWCFYSTGQKKPNRELGAESFAREPRKYQKHSCIILITSKKNYEIILIRWIIATQKNGHSSPNFR